MALLLHSNIKNIAAWLLVFIWSKPIEMDRERSRKKFFDRFRLYGNRAFRSYDGFRSWSNTIEILEPGSNFSIEFDPLRSSSIIWKPFFDRTIEMHTIIYHVWQNLSAVLLEKRSKRAERWLIPILLWKNRLNMIVCI